MDSIRVEEGPDPLFLGMFEPRHDLTKAEWTAHVQR